MRHLRREAARCLSQAPNCPPKMISTEYLAGFFDGEGCIGVYRGMHHGRPGFHLRTQLTQNINDESIRLLTELTVAYGGNGSVMCRSRCQRAFNWQLNGDGAARFLDAIEPHLRLKREQARIAISWQRQRPPRARNARGHIVFKTEPIAEFDQRVSEIMRELKTASLKALLADRPELSETAHSLLPELVGVDDSLGRMREIRTRSQFLLWPQGDPLENEQSKGGDDLAHAVELHDT